MTDTISAGSRLMQLLSAYGVDTLFGMPGVHTLEAYRGLEAAGIKHIGVRHEQGAGFMADGYARMTGKPGVCLLISGPGVTNAATPIGQAYSDSVPLLVITSVASTDDLGMGRGRLHDVTDQSRVTEPLTTFSATALNPNQVHEYVARAFASFASGRKRPVHISLPLDVITAPDNRPAIAKKSTGALAPVKEEAHQAASILATSEHPVLIVGGGARHAFKEVIELAEKIGAAVVPTITGKGIMADQHPLCVESTLDREATQAFLCRADVVLAVGTELAEPDLWLEKPLALKGKFIRIDIDRQMLALDYDPNVAICADSVLALQEIITHLPEQRTKGFLHSDKIKRLRSEERENLSKLEKAHIPVINAIRNAIPEDGVVYTDMTQLAYTACAVYPCYKPNTFHFPAGFGTLGYGLPAGIGGKIASPNTPVAIFVGDGGFQFTLQELGTAVENALPLAIILWDNDSLAQIRDGMIVRDIPTIGVNQFNPDFSALAKAYGCHVAEPKSLDAIEIEVSKAFKRNRPTVIRLRESDFITG